MAREGTVVGEALHVHHCQPWENLPTCGRHGQELRRLVEDDFRLLALLRTSLPRRRCARSWRRSCFGDAGGISVILNVVSNGKEKKVKTCSANCNCIPARKSGSSRKNSTECFGEKKCTNCGAVWYQQGQLEGTRGSHYEVDLEDSESHGTLLTADSLRHGQTTWQNERRASRGRIQNMGDMRVGGVCNEGSKLLINFQMATLALFPHRYVHAHVGRPRCCVQHERRDHRSRKRGRKSETRGCGLLQRIAEATPHETS